MSSLGLLENTEWEPCWYIAYAQLLYHRTSITGSVYLFAGSCFEQYSQFVSFSEM